MDQDYISKNVERAVAALRQAQALLITAGAGMGVDSGLPDFRGKEGFWKAYPPLAQLGKSFYEMANPHWFDHEPKLAWAFYGHRLKLYRQTEPHAGFRQLLDLAQQMRGGYFVFTSNVDGQFQKAGFAPDRIEECHGSIHHLQCIQPCRNDIWNADDIAINIDDTLFQAQEPLPHCRNCSRLARPNILMFGDWGWVSERSHAQSRRFQDWMRQVDSEQRRLVVIEVGAGQTVPTVRHQAERAARRSNTTLIRINPRDYNVPAGHIALPLGGGEGICSIVEPLL